MIDNKKVQKALDEVGLTMNGFIVEKYPDAKAANKRVQISRLRKLIEDDPNDPKYLQTKWGFGYIFNPDGE